MRGSVRTRGTEYPAARSRLITANSRGFFGGALPGIDAQHEVLNFGWTIFNCLQRESIDISFESAAEQCDFGDSRIATSRLIRMIERLLSSLNLRNCQIHLILPHVKIKS